MSTCYYRKNVPALSVHCVTIIFEVISVAKTATLNIRIDPETKAGAEQLYASFGITVSDAVAMFLRQSLAVGGLPFPLVRPDGDPVLARAKEALGRIRENATRNGTDKLAMAEIDAEIAAARTKRKARKG
jgi:DNA-damage-inducible protein J